MFRLEGDVLHIELPQGKSQAELVKEAETEIDEIIKSGALYGKDLKINGRITTGIALMLGHKLAHVCRIVSIFDPKLNSYIVCIKH